MNKRGIIIILYSVALLAVFAVILLATVEPKSFTVEVGQTHAEIVRTTEAIQNYNSYAKDAAEVSYYRSVEHLDNREEFKREFIFNFEENLQRLVRIYRDPRLVLDCMRMVR